MDISPEDALVNRTVPPFAPRRRAPSGRAETPAERPAAAPQSLLRMTGGGLLARQEEVATEAPVALVYNCRSHAVMMATPADLEDFAVGFSLAEGVVETVEEIGPIRIKPQGPGMAVSLQIPDARAAALNLRRRSLEGRTGCGLCGLVEIDQALPNLPVLPPSAPITAAAIRRALAALPEGQNLNRRTGAAHAAALADRSGRILCLREDVGRHNALDKVIGAAARQGLDPRRSFLLVTSRCSMEMVQKTLRFGAPLLVAISAPTSLAVTLAETGGLTVAAFARAKGFNLYSHPGRVV